MPCEIQGDNPIHMWEAFKSMHETSKLAELVILLLKIVVNQVGSERVFSNLRVKQTDGRNHLGLQKLQKMTKVSCILVHRHCIHLQWEYRSGAALFQSIKQLALYPPVASIKITNQLAVLTSLLCLAIVTC
jgi:hypothetical protein